MQQLEGIRVPGKGTQPVSPGCTLLQVDLLQQQTTTLLEGLLSCIQALYLVFYLWQAVGCGWLGVVVSWGGGGGCVMDCTVPALVRLQCLPIVVAILVWEVGRLSSRLSNQPNPCPACCKVLGDVIKDAYTMQQIVDDLSSCLLVLRRNNHMMQ